MVAIIHDFSDIKRRAFGLKTEPPQDVVVPRVEPEIDYGMYAGYADAYRDAVAEVYADTPAADLPFGTVVPYINHGTIATAPSSPADLSGAVRHADFQRAYNKYRSYKAARDRLLAEITAENIHPEIGGD